MPLTVLIKPVALKPSADLKPVGASLLAMDVNDNARILEKCGALEFFASRLAPTVIVI
jgi:hypothetical protein